MNLSRCENGHFYDKEKYASCPHCAQGAGTEESMTTVFDENGEANAVGETQSLQQPPIKNNNGNVGAVDMTEQVKPRLDIFDQIPGQAVSNAGFEMPPMPNSPVAPQVMSGWNQSLAGGTDVTAPANSNVGSAITGMPEEDDDHTEAFYGDLFAVTPSVTETPETQMNASSTRSTRSSTPCVGWLVALSGGHLGQDFRLKPGKNFLGRDRSMDVVLDGDKSVSRNKHAIIVYEPKQHLYLVQPGESSELVYLNDEVVLSPVKLKAYDKITVGEVTLLFMPLCGEQFNWSQMLQKK